MKIRLSAAVLVLLTALPAMALYSIGDTVQEFQLPDPGGTQWHLSTLSRTATIITLWATW